MRKVSMFMVALFLSVFALVGCSNEEADNAEPAAETNETEEAELDEQTYEPEAINPDTDVCDVCAMAVADDQYATQIVLTNDRSLKFDDIGCLYGWIEENGEDEIGAKYVRDFHSEEWIVIDDATYVFGEEIETPMAYGVISFKDAAEAEAYIEEHGHGEILSASDLSDHKWEMMMHDHDDHDHDDRGDHE